MWYIQQRQWMHIVIKHNWMWGCWKSPHWRNDILAEIWKDLEAAQSLQSCPTLCDPIDRGPPGPPVPGILQARTLEWVAISFSNVWKGKVKVKSLSRVRLFATPWSAAYQAPPSMGFSRQEYWEIHTVTMCIFFFVLSHFFIIIIELLLCAKHRARP